MEDALIAIALCPCGHGVERHDEAGCPGARATFCMCTRTPGAALDAAIEAVRHDALRRASERRSTPRTRCYRGAPRLRSA